MGGEADAYWRQTPRLLSEWFSAKARAAEHQFKSQAWHTWHTMLPHVKKMPPLPEFRGDKPAPPRKRTADELLAIAHQWEAASGGLIKVTRH